MCALQVDEGVVGHIRDSHRQASPLVLAVAATRRPTSRGVKTLAVAHLQSQQSNLGIYHRKTGKQEEPNWVRNVEFATSLLTRSLSQQIVHDNYGSFEFSFDLRMSVGMGSMVLK
jgi:hypothetical protein